MTRKRQKPRKIPVQDRAKVTWNVILDAAAQVLLRHGYEKATTDRIAERAGVSIGSVYEYFPNKESIFAALMLRFNGERWAALRANQIEEETICLAAAVRATVRARGDTLEPKAQYGAQSRGASPRQLRSGQSHVRCFSSAQPREAQHPP